MLNLAAHRQKYDKAGRSSAEMAPWLIMVRPNVVLNKDGSLLACFEFDGVDYEGLRASEIDQYSQIVEQGMRAFNERNTVWFTVDRRRTKVYPKSQDFNDEISQYVDDAWEADFNDSLQYKNSYYVSLLYTPKDGAEGFYDRITYFVNEGYSVSKALLEAAKVQLLNKEAFAFSSAMIDTALNEFEGQIRTFEETVDGLQLRPLLNEELLSYLHHRISPASPQSVRKPREWVYLDGYLVDNQLTVHGNELEFEHVDRQFVTACSIKEWPQGTKPGIMDALLAVSGEITLSQCFRFVEYSAAKQFIEDIERHNLTLSKSIFGHIKEAITGEATGNIDHGRLALAGDATDAKTELTAEGKTYGYYNITVLCYGETSRESDRVLREVAKTMARQEFITVRETMHLLSAWAGTIPGQHKESVRWCFVNIANMGDLAPARTLQVGHAINDHLSEQAQRPVTALAVLPTELSTPFYFNYHHGDLGHTFIVGPSGAGKSVFTNFLTSQFRKYNPSNIYIFDKDYSCRIPTLLQGGQHIDLVGEKSHELKLNPIAAITDKACWPWIHQWVSGLIESSGHTMTAEDEQQLDRAIQLVYDSAPESHKLASFMGYLDKHLALQLHKWVTEGRYAKYFDNLEDGFNLTSFTCIEMGALFQIPEVARAFLDYAFFKINRAMTGVPTKIYIEECWFMLEDEKFAAKIRDYLKTIRKKNGFVVMVTQSLDDIAGSKIFSSIIDNCPTKIFLPNNNAMANYELYAKKFSLNDEQIKRIQYAIPKQNYYVVTPTISRMVTPKFPANILAVVRSDARAQKMFEQHYAMRETNPNWKFDYIKDMVDEN